MRPMISCVTEISKVSPELVDFARRQISCSSLYRGDERRSAERHPMMLPIRAVVVDDDANPIGDEFYLVTREVASNSIGLVHDRPLDSSRRLAIQFHVAGTEFNLIVEIVWSGPLGEFFGAGGKFVGKLDVFPLASSSSQY